MSNYHILELSNKQHKLTVAFHVAIPDSNNSVGLNYRTVLVQYLTRNGDLIESRIPWITTELTSLQNGSLYESVEIVEVDANLSLAEKRAIADTRWTTLSTALPAKMENILDFWGMDRDVP